MSVSEKDFKLEKSVCVIKRENLKCQYQESKRGHHSEPADIKKIKGDYYEQPYVYDFDNLNEMSRFCVGVLYPFRFVCVHRGSGFPNQAVLQHQPGILQFNSILTLATWRHHSIRFHR